MRASVGRSIRDDPLAATMLEDPFEAILEYPPYPGLRPFVSAEWPIFFGRETMTDEIIDLVTKKHLVVVHGDSGCGKSSIVRAGVLVQLQQSHAATDATWRTCAMLPRDDPLSNLARALAGLLADEPTPDQTLDIRHILNRGRRAPENLTWLLRRDESDHICILIDQFEELFRLAREDLQSEAQLFVDLLTAIAEDRPPGFYAILTMRSEFLGACARLKGLAETVNATQYLLPQMDRLALLRAIRGPAQLYGGEVSNALAERLIADAGGTQDQLPLIQHGLMLLWRRESDRRSKEITLDNQLQQISDERVAPARRPPGLDLEQYTTAVASATRASKLDSGLAALLSAHADEVMTRAAPDPERAKIVEHLFRALTEINSEGHAVRRP